MTGYRCVECFQTFKDPMITYEPRGEYSERLYVCPYCRSEYFDQDNTADYDDEEFREGYYEPDVW